MTQAQFQAAARYWEEKDAASVKLDPAQLRSVAEAYIQANNTCALATGAGAYVRCTPIEYSFHDGAFWMLSEGGKNSSACRKIPTYAWPFSMDIQGFKTCMGCRSWARPRSWSPFPRTIWPMRPIKAFPWIFLKGGKRPCI